MTDHPEQQVRIFFFGGGQNICLFLFWRGQQLLIGETNLGPPGAAKAEATPLEKRRRKQQCLKSIELLRSRCKCPDNSEKSRKPQRRLGRCRDV